MESKPTTHRLRPLLPSVDGRLRRTSPEVSTDRRNVTTACGACRKRKIKCDGVRPTCSPCVKKQKVCEYNSEPDETPSQALKRKYSELYQNKSARNELYDILCTRSDHDANLILRKIRAGVSPDSVLRYVKDGDLLLQVALAPETRFRYDFPIVKSMPRYLIKPDNYYLTSRVYRSTFHSVTTASTDILDAQPGSLIRSGSPYHKPYHSAHIVEPKIDNLLPSRWTSVTSDNALMRSILGDYFLHEYQWFPVFQKDYFLDDMATGSTRFCSSLLVNALLARACQNCVKIQNRADFWNPKTLYYGFLAEAKRLWEFADKGDAAELPTIQASILIDICYRHNGLDKIGLAYLQEALAMAKNIQLFHTFANDMDKTEHNARTFTAWCLFSYQMMQTYYFFTRPIIETPPAAPLPDPAQSRDWYGEIWLTYPEDSSALAVHFGHAFKAMVELHVLMGEIALQAFSIPGKIKKISCDKALECQSKLESWYSRLPIILSPRNIVFPAQLKIHLEFHRTVWTLLESLTELGPAENKGYILKATVHFETLVRIYFLRHGFTSPDSFLLLYLITLGFFSLDRLQTEQDPVELNALYSVILLCGRGVFEQSQSFYVAEAMLHLLRGKMDPSILNMLGSYVPTQPDIGSRWRMAARLNRSELPLPTTTVGEDIDLARMERMLKEIEAPSPCDDENSSNYSK